MKLIAKRSVKLLADEGIDRPVVEALRNVAWDIKYILEISPGIPDDEVLALANSEQRVLLTQDKDFGELIFRLRSIHSGVILIRLEGFNPGQKAEIVSQVLAGHQHELFASFTVVQPNAVRIRK